MESLLNNETPFHKEPRPEDVVLQKFSIYETRAVSFQCLKFRFLMYTHRKLKKYFVLEEYESTNLTISMTEGCFLDLAAVLHVR